MDAFRKLLHQANIATTNPNVNMTNTPRPTNLSTQIPMTQTINSVNNNVGSGTMTSMARKEASSFRLPSCLNTLHIPTQDSLDTPSSANSEMSDKFQISEKYQISNKRKSRDFQDEQYEEMEDPKAKRRAQIAKAARKHRQRQKDELIALRAKVKDLKEQIEILQSSEPSEHNTELGWKKEAEQHAEIRARVDQENNFLRRTLTEQMKFIQRLQDYFTKQPLLNMPSLEMILNSSSANANANDHNAQHFENSLLDVAKDAMNQVASQIRQCNASFQSPKNPTMTYFGIEVQYETSKDDMFIYFRHYMNGVKVSVMAQHVWDNFGNSTFESKYPFVDSVKVLKEIDSNTKYIRRVLNLTISGDVSSTQTSLKEEGLSVQQQRFNSDGSVDFISRNIMEDPEHLQSALHIRRSGTTMISLQKYANATGTGCLLLWSTRVILKNFENDDDQNIANHPDVILKNLFEIIPAFVKGIVDKARV